MKFEPLQRQRLDPAVRFKSRGQELAATVGDFWVWALSDLQDNTTRGLLAEYIVATALEAELLVRSSWADVDVRTPDGLGVEVKACARLQSWSQRRLSTVSFGGLRGRSWHPERGYSATQDFRADAYVFALQTAESHEAYDVLNLDQWAFWVATRETVKAHGARSVALSTVERWAGPSVSYDELAGRFSKVVRGAGNQADRADAKGVAANRPDPMEQKGLEQEMEEGYRAEALSPSLDPEWSNLEVEGLD